MGKAVKVGAMVGATYGAFCGFLLMASLRFVTEGFGGGIVSGLIGAVVGGVALGIVGAVIGVLKPEIGAETPPPPGH